eukprot:1194249-Prorocentrum_minimum.AAC.3
MSDFLDFFKGTDEEVQNEWLYYLEEAKENSGELYSMLNNRSVLLHKKKDAALLSAQIRRNIAKLKGQLNGLQGLLQKHADKITEGEHTRRSDDLSRMRREINLMEDNMMKEGRVNNARSKSGYGTEREGKETERTKEVATHQLASVQTQMLEEQDAELDQLSKHIRNLKSISGAINEEITMHNHMLEDLEGDMEKSSSKMHQGKVKLDNMESESSCIIS